MEKIAREILQVAKELTAASAKNAAKELARAFDGDMEKNMMSDYDVYWVSFKGVKGSGLFTVDDDYLVIDKGRLTGEEKMLAKGIARRFGLDADID